MNRVRPIGGLAVVVTMLALAGCAAGQATGISSSNSAVKVTHEGRAVLEYRFQEVPFKPYVKELYSPAGVNVLRDAPADHKHHHALMFAVAVDGVNFWEEGTPAAGRQVHVSMGPLKTSSTKGQSRSTMTEKLRWADRTDQTLLLEERTLEWQAGPSIGATLLTWRTVLSLPGGKQSAKLTGSHYFGLGMRFVESMDKGGRFIYADGVAPGTVVRGDERVTQAKWCAYAAKADGKDVTVAMFDHPKNIRHPATFFTMGKSFSYVSATLNLWKEPLTMQEKQPLDLRYGVAVWDGQVSAEAIEKVYRMWVEAAGE